MFSAQTLRISVKTGGISQKTQAFFAAVSGLRFM